MSFHSRAIPKTGLDRYVHLKGNAMTIVADVVDYSIGVDTHTDTHTLVVIDGRNHAVIAETVIETHEADYARAVEWANIHTSGHRVWAIEGTGSYGAGLTRYLYGVDEWPVEVERPSRPKKQRADKDDSIDARRAAREALGADIDQVVQPKHGETRETLAVLMATRDGAVHAATAAKNALHAAILAAPEHFRRRFDNLNTARKVAVAAALRPNSFKSQNDSMYAAALQATARRVQTLEAEAQAHHTRILTLVKDWRPDLLDVYGVGALVAARILVAWSHAGRCRNEAAFAMLAGTAPIAASSGRTTGRVRLNPGGDRKLNAALHTVALTRMRSHDETKAYTARRKTQGKTDREIRRCLKRYITRQLFKQLEHTP